MGYHALQFIYVQLTVPFTQYLERDAQWNDVRLVITKLRIFGKSCLNFLEKIAESQVS